MMGIVLFEIHKMAILEAEELEVIKKVAYIFLT